MKFILSIIVLIARFYIIFQIVKWILLKSIYPKEHSFSEIEVYCVFMVFETWINLSLSSMEVKLLKDDEQM